MTARRMKKLLKKLNIPNNSVYIPDNDRILKGVKEKIEYREEHDFVRISFMRVFGVAVTVMLIMAFATVSFGKNSVWKQIFTFLEEPTEQAEEFLTENTQKDVYIYKGEVEPTELVTEAETDVVAPIKPKVEFVPSIAEKKFPDSVEKAEEYVSREGVSIEDDNYVFTLMESIGDSYSVYMEMSLQGKNPDAIKRLMEDGWKFNAQVYTNQGWIAVSGGAGENKDTRTHDTRFFTLSYSSDRHGKFTKARVKTELMSDYIEFDISSDIDEISFELLGQDFTGGFVAITPMGINLTFVRERSDTDSFDYPDLEIKFKNGEQRSLISLHSGNGGASSKPIDSTYSRVNYTATWKEIIDLNTIESVIFKNIEYPIYEPTDYKRIGQAKEKAMVKIIAEKYDGMEYPVYLTDVIRAMSIEPIITPQGYVEFTLYDEIYHVEPQSNAVTGVDGEMKHFLSAAPQTDGAGNIVVDYEFLHKIFGLPLNLSEDGTHLIVH